MYITYSLGFSLKIVISSYVTMLQGIMTLSKIYLKWFSILDIESSLIIVLLMNLTAKARYLFGILVLDRFPKASKCYWSMGSKYFKTKKSAKGLSVSL